MRKYWLFLFAFGLIMLTLTQPGEARRSACSDCGGYEQGPGYQFNRWTKKDLDLSKEQVKKLDTLELQFEKETINLRNEIQSKQLELRELWTADTPDETKINTKIDEIAKLRAEIEKKRTSHLLEVKKVLTDEQWSKLQSGPGFRGKVPEGRGPRKKGH